MEDDEKKQLLSMAVLESYREDSGAVRESPFPGGDRRPFGREFRIFFEKSVYDDIVAHSFVDDRIELGGVLIGELGSDDFGAWLRVTANIRGKYSESSISQVTFTHETWNYICEKKDREFPDSHIVGWYHTHPKFGIFLSEMDVFIHENFFGKAYQIAMVVDPVNKSEGVFMKSGGKITALKGFWVGGEEHLTTQDKTGKQVLEERLEKIEQLLKQYAAGSAPESREGRASTSGSLGWICAGILLLFIFAQTFLFRGDQGRLRSNEMLLFTQDDTLHGVQLRVYAAPLINHGGIIIRERGDGVEGTVVMPDGSPSQEPAPPQETASPAPESSSPPESSPQPESSSPPEVSPQPESSPREKASPGEGK